MDPQPDLYSCSTTSVYECRRRRVSAGRWIGIFTLLTVGAPGAAVIDHRGVTIALERPAQRVVVLSPSIAELVFEVGAGAAIVGAVEFTDYPAAARRITRVGDAMRLDVERILTLAPDLVLAWSSGNDPRDLARLEARAIPVYVLEPTTLESVADELAVIGELVGKPAEGAAAAAAFRARKAALRGQTGERSPVSVFVQIWESPLMTVNGRHIISDVVGLCGGRNIFADLAPLAPTVSHEGVLARDPAVIIISRGAEAEGTLRLRWQRWPGLSAVRSGNVVEVPADLLTRPTSRILEGAERVCQALALARGR